MNRIILLCDEINSGKTSNLKTWLSVKKNVFGVLSPKVGEGRIFENVQTGEKWKMEAGSESDVLLVGRYKFSPQAFEKAIDAIHKGLEAKDERFVVIDEIGPLEFQGLGFHSILLQSLAKLDFDSNLTLILVIRKKLLENFISEFQPKNYQVLNVIKFLSLGNQDLDKN